MNFSGYVQLRRGLLEHLQDGRLTPLEFATLTTLILLASKDTGSSTINANTLGSFMGDGLDYTSDVPRNRQRGKQRVLQALEDKRYIYRQVVPHSKRAYRYWVDKYVATGGQHKSRRLDLSKVFQTKDINDIQYISPVAETVADGVAETVAETVASNKKGNKRKTRENTPLSYSAVCASECSPKHDSSQRTSATHTCEQGDDPVSAHERGAHGGAQMGIVQMGLSSSVQGTHWTFGDALPGYVFQCGGDPGYRSVLTGTKISADEVRRIAANGVERQ